MGWAIGCYVMAKLLEDTDLKVWSLTARVTGGHTLKHLFAALGCYLVVVMIKTRQRI